MVELSFLIYNKIGFILIFNKLATDKICLDIYMVFKRHQRWILFELLLWISNWQWTWAKIDFNFKYVIEYSS